MDREELTKLSESTRYDDSDAICTKAEFILRMLTALGTIQDEDIQLCERRFDELDKKRDGQLSIDDVGVFAS